MEDKKQVGSSSSFTAELFGSKEPKQSSSTGVFASIFHPPSKMVGSSTSNSEMNTSWHKQPFGNQVWNSKQGTTVPYIDGRNKDMSSIFQEQKVEPCHLSSSLYYGGQDIYSPPTSTQTCGSYPIFKKDGGGEGDDNGNNSQDASRGNWWQGSLYY